VNGWLKRSPEPSGNRLLKSRDLQSVLIGGHLDLPNIAASLTRRLRVLADDLQTVVAGEAEAMDTGSRGG